MTTVAQDLDYEDVFEFSDSDIDADTTEVFSDPETSYHSESPQRWSRPRLAKSVSTSSDDGYGSLSQYKFIDQNIGEGTFSVIRLAINERDNNRYAMKILSKGKLTRRALLRKNSNSPLQDPYRETAILGKISHPNILTIHEVLDDPRDDAMVMVFEYMDGGPIMTVPSLQVIREPLAIRYLRDILSAVEYLHGMQIIHRDLKPENILCDSCGRLKVCDFGLSIQLESSEDDMTMLPYGTPAYTAPECLDEGLTQHSAKAMEMYAIGITLYALLFGNVPFADDNVFRLYEMIQKDPLIIPIRPHISLHLRDLLNGLLQKNPKNRWTLEAVLSSKALSEKPAVQASVGRCKKCPTSKLCRHLI